MTAAKNVREALLPCPFCNSVDVTVGYDGQPARMIYVVCSVCGAQGPYERSDQTQFTGLYVEYWNTRKLSATAAGDAEHTLARVLSVAHVGRKRAPRWSHVGALTSHGSGKSIALCRRFGLDPNEVLGNRDPVTWAALAAQESPQ